MTATTAQATEQVHRMPTQRPDRADIQGLRAFAVVVVILDHLTGWPTGGFVGVDIFFVISGFLITGVLLREHERTGHIGFVQFYRRRIRRVVPAAVLVLAVTLVAAWGVFNTVRFRSTSIDALWAFLFAGNWRFASLSTDYFDATGPVSPLQHYWSLGIEEQFYFVWPWLMLGIFSLLLRRKQSIGSARVVVGCVITALTSTSFAWAVWETTTNPGLAYFSTFSRTWELGVGAMLAVAAPALIRMPNFIRPVLAWIGVAGMTASLWLINADDSFPAPGAAVPVLSAALVIVAGTGINRQRYLFPLTNRVVTYVGDISYSLYLWHFPVIIIGFVLWSDDIVTRLALGVAILVLSVYSFHLIEDPVRRSKWLERRHRAPSIRSKKESATYQNTLLSFVALVVVVITGFAFRIPSAPTGIDVTPSTPSRTDAIEQAQPPLVTALQDQIVIALEASEYPSLQPSFDAVLAGPQAPDDVHNCGTTARIDIAACSWGDRNAKNTAVVVGDSMSVIYALTVRKALVERGWRVILLGKFGCQFTKVTFVQDDAKLQDICPARVANAVSTIKAVKPDLVLISNVYSSGRVVGTEGRITEDDWAESTVELVRSFRSSVRHVGFVAPPPDDKALEACYGRGTAPSKCVSKVSSGWMNRAGTEREMAIDVNGSWLDSQPWFCFERYCPAFVGDTPVKVDTTHLTLQYAEKIAPVMREAMVKEQLLG